ncbi:MAG: fibronectin type III domain-containing protein [Candidatus Thermoplasmatota archaeon]
MLERSGRLKGAKGAALLLTTIILLIALGGCVRAPPKMFIVTVLMDGARVEGAVVNITNFRNGLRWSGTTDSAGEYMVSPPVGDPGGDIIVGDTVVITAAKDGKLGLEEVEILNYDPTERVEIELGAANTPPNPVRLNPPVAEDTYMDVRWNESEDKDFGMYILYISKDEDALGSAVWKSNDITLNFARVANLEPGTRYYLRMAVVDAAGAHALSNQVSATTKGVSQSTWIYLLLAMVIIAALLVAALLLRRKRQGQDRKQTMGHEGKGRKARRRSR